MSSTSTLVPDHNGTTFRSNLSENSLSWQDISVATRPSRSRGASKKLLDGISGRVEGGMLQFNPKQTKNYFDCAC
jgi:hypothetical protein